MKQIILVISAMAIVGCSTAPPPTIQEGPNAEVSYDGLHAIDNSVFRQAWADPEIDFSRYSKIMAGGAFLEFRAVRNASTSRARSSASEFYIDDSNRERLQEETSTIFGEEIANSTRFTMTEEAGPDVLIIRGGLHDIVSNVPPERMGRSDIFITSVGEITLILEVADSMSGEVIFRAVERRAAQRAGGQGIRSSTVTNWSEIRRLLRRWATTLREGLDTIPDA